MRAAEAAEAAKVLRQVLAEVDAGNLVNTGPRGGHLLRRLEGAAVALEVAASTRRQRPATGDVAP